MDRVRDILDNIRNRNILKLLLIVCAYVFVIWLIWTTIPRSYYVDWIIVFRPAVRRLITLQSPYTEGGVYNPPWAFLFLIPLALLPPKVGAVLLSLATFFAMVFIAKKMEANILQITIFLTIPQFAIKTITNPNIDFLAAIGFILPPQIGLFFLAIKPQLGIGVAIFWFFAALRKGGVREVVRVFAPVMIALLVSFILFGPYIFAAQRLVVGDDVWWDYGLWPYAVPVGLALLALAMRKREKGFAISSSPFLSPYVASYSWPYAILGLIRYPIEYIASAIGLWIVYIYLRFQF